MLDADTRDALDALLEAAVEMGPEWCEDILGYVEEDLCQPLDDDMVKDGIDDPDERGATKAVVTMKALYLAYQEALTDIEDVDARTYLQRAVEAPGALPQPVAPVVGARPLVLPAPVLVKLPGFTPPKLGG